MVRFQFADRQLVPFFGPPVSLMAVLILAGKFLFPVYLRRKLEGKINILIFLFTLCLSNV